MSYRAVSQQRPDRCHVTVEEYSHFQREGCLVVPGLVPMAEVGELKRHADGILRGDVPLQGLEPPPEGSTEADLLQRFTRVHMLHRADAVSERFFLQPRILDVLEALIGPDVLALQTMLFFNPPGKGGQGWHQDSYYITTYPDTLIGVWLALEPADEENGCLWVAPGSHCETVYPSPDPDEGFVHAQGAFANLHPVRNVSHLDNSVNTLSQVALTYESVPVEVDPGDVVFFHGHLLHRSYPNRTQNRWRRAFVSHYCNARSWVPWNHGQPYEGEAANQCHILARGATHLPYATPVFGTPCAATEPTAHEGHHRTVRMMAEDGMVQAVTVYMP